MAVGQCSRSMASQPRCRQWLRRRVAILSLAAIGSVTVTMAVAVAPLSWHPRRGRNEAWSWRPRDTAPASGADRRRCSRRWGHIAVTFGSQITSTSTFSNDYVTSPAHQTDRASRLRRGRLANFALGIVNFGPTQRSTRGCVAASYASPTGVTALRLSSLSSHLSCRKPVLL